MVNYQQKRAAGTENKGTKCHLFLYPLSISHYQFPILNYPFIFICYQAVEFKRILRYHIGMKKQIISTSQALKAKKATKRVDYDTAWKDVLKDMLEPFLEFLFPEIHQDIDFSRKPQYISKDLPRFEKDNNIGNRFADVLVKVYLKDGSIRCLFIHIEVQGSPDWNLAERMYVYNYRVYDHHREFNEEVVSLAILTDDNPDYRPDHYAFSRWGFNHIMTYPTVKMLDYQDRLAALEQSTNPMALVVIAQLKSFEAKKADDQARYNIKLQLFRDCFNKGYNKKQIRALIKYIDWIINLPDQYKEKLRDQLIILEEEKKMPYVTTFEQMAAKKARVEALKEGKKNTTMELAQKMLIENFPMDAIIRITGLKKKDLQPLLQQ
jgi:hypothetical protein